MKPMKNTKLYNTNNLKYRHSGRDLNMEKMKIQREGLEDQIEEVSQRRKRQKGRNRGENIRNKNQPCEL